MTTSPENVKEFCKASLARDVLPELRAMADALRLKHQGAVAILAYGSCLRGVAVADTLMDFYVLTENFSGVSPNIISRVACCIVPPNVYYVETEFDGQRLRAKYALLPLRLFSKWMTRETSNPYFWARFSQPSALVYARDDRTRDEVVAGISEALRTGFANAKALTTETDVLAIWTAGFSATYKTEFRSEKANRAASIVSSAPDYYREAARLLASEVPIHASQTLRRLTGKGWSVLRLIKAAFTFQGGADYIVWKIERHSGEKIILAGWQRRHPIIAGLLLLPALLRKGAIR
ncbi:MAG: hypothetical protein H7X89_10045 [Rhizobiales bacterium]|nr:hypothetical protein [Hyphomicrobiales bacterium]